MTEQSLAALAGHDPDAMWQIAGFLDVYRERGLSALRVDVERLLDGRGMPTAREFRLAGLIVEAVLTIAERTGTSASQRRDAWAHHDAEDARTEQEQTDRGGNR